MTKHNDRTHVTYYTDDQFPLTAESCRKALAAVARQDAYTLTTSGMRYIELAPCIGPACAICITTAH